jgi:type VI secretion system protein ImpK
VSQPSADAPQAANQVGSLVELAAPIAKLIADLSGDQPPQDAEALRSRFEDAFRSFESRAIRTGYTEGETASAKYALAGTADEVILLSNLPVKDEWLGRPLQMIFFDDFSAGETFYEKLDAARTNRTPRAPEVLEVFHLCLALGFKGKYGDNRGAERRRVLMDAVAGEINQARGVSADSSLSPAGLPGETGAAAPRRIGFLTGGPIWLVPLAVIVVVMMALIVFGVRNDSGLSDIPAHDAAAGAKP